MAKIGPGWYGMLTVNNVEQVAEVLRQLLEGKRYTFVAVNMYGTEITQGHLVHRPEVRTGQRLKSSRAISLYHDNDDKYAGFNVGDSYGVWGCSTNQKEDKYDPEFNNPYIVFEWHIVRITHRALAGHLLYWVIAIEQDEADNNG